MIKRIPKKKGIAITVAAEAEREKSVARNDNVNGRRRKLIMIVTAVGTGITNERRIDRPIAIEAGIGTETVNPVNTTDTKATNSWKRNATNARVRWTWILNRAAKTRKKRKRRRRNRETAVIARRRKRRRTKRNERSMWHLMYPLMNFADTVNILIIWRNPITSSSRRLSRRVSWCQKRLLLSLISPTMTC